MNIHGHKQKIKEAVEELKQGERYLGKKRFEDLGNRICCWRNCIKILREQRKKKNKHHKSKIL